MEHRDEIRVRVLITQDWHSNGLCVLKQKGRLGMKEISTSEYLGRWWCWRVILLGGNLWFINMKMMAPTSGTLQHKSTNR